MVFELFCNCYICSLFFQQGRNKVQLKLSTELLLMQKKEQGLFT